MFKRFKLLAIFIGSTAVLTMFTTHSQVAEGADCIDSWSKVIPNANDRFELVMGVGVDIGGGEILLKYEAVLDHETCLVWELAPSSADMNWHSARAHCISKKVGNRFGWRLPTIQELGSVMDDTNGGISVPKIAAGHPFLNLQPEGYWSATSNDSFSNVAYNVNLSQGSFILFTPDKGVSKNLHAWCVRSGRTFEGPSSAVIGQ